MTDYKQKDVFLSHGKVTKNDKTTVSSKSKTCQAIDECDKNTYSLCPAINIFSHVAHDPSQH